MPILVIIVIVLIVIAVVAKVSIVEVYYLKLKSDKDAKARVAFKSVFGRSVSYNLHRYFLTRELPPFPTSYSTYLKYQRKIQFLNRFITFCLFLLMLFAAYKIVMIELVESSRPDRLGILISFISESSFT